MNRRDFLKFFGIGLSTAIAGSVGLSRPVRGDETSYIYLPLIFQSGWTNVTPPLGWDRALPFTIQQYNRRFRPSHTFDISNHSGITIAKTYYFDKLTGDDSNTGADWDHALKTVRTAALKTDVDRIYIKAGSYFYCSELPSSPARSIKFIGVGSPSPSLTRNIGNEMSVWSAVDNHYECTVINYRYAASATDATNPNVKSGKPGRLTRMTSIAEVDANPNSFWQSESGYTRTIYLRTFDSRAPDADIQVSESGLTWRADNITWYFENLSFLNTGFNLYNNTAAGGLKFYAKDVIARSWTIHGPDEAILQNCGSDWPGGDGFNYDICNGIVPLVIEIDCYQNGNTGGPTSQASTAHKGVQIVRINGKYHDASGQCIADVTGCKTWCLSSEVYNSVTGIGFYTSGTMWLDSCWSHDNYTYDLQNTAGSTIYIRDFIGALGINDIGGTLSTY